MIEISANRAMAGSELEFVDWGLVEYQLALSRQMELVSQVGSGVKVQTIVFCSHPPVVTLGRGTRSGDVFGWKGSIVEISRGGRATYHGPNQLVAYPIVNLSLQRKSLPSRDLHAYLRGLENAIVRTLKFCGVTANGSPATGARSLASEGEATGVWIGKRKIASIGIGVRRWVSYHGLAINLDYDPNAFQGLNPCGFSQQTMISLEEVLGTKIDRAHFQLELQKNLNDLLR